MTPQRWQQIETVFQAAAELQPPEREAFLDRTCGDDSDLRAEVESLLTHEGFDTFIKSPIQETARSLTNDEDDSRIGQRMGAYRITGLIGHGGMGTVYRAVRDDQQFLKEVALKLVKRGLDTDFVLNRFRYERQILATLEHAHIARLLDGGTTEAGG
jgi:eukaryotic-like serine/threonine-protein kinase